MKQYPCTFLLLAQATWVRVSLWAILASGRAVWLLPGVSLAGHVGGLATGALMGLLIPIKNPEAGLSVPVG